MFDAALFDTHAALAVHSPESAYVRENITPACSKQISGKYYIPLEILASVRLAEGGYAGHIRKNTDNSYDVGPMQINSVNWRKINEALGTTPIELRYNGCKNLEAGAFLLRQHLDAERENIHSWPDMIRVIANYHSATPVHNIVYQQIVTEKLVKIVHRFPRGTLSQVSGGKS